MSVFFRKIMPWLMVAALSITVFTQQMELDSLRKLVMTQNSAIMSLADDSSKNSRSISDLSEAINSHSEALKTVDQTIRMLGGLK